MTLTAIARTAHAVAILTDSVRYSRHGGHFGTCTKSFPLPHLDAAVVGRGDSLFCLYADSGAMQLSGQVSDFDALLENAPEWLTDLWRRRAAEGGTPEESMIFLVGYSPAREEFVAIGFGSVDGFAPFEIADMWVFPMPYAARPTDQEVDMMRRLQNPPEDLEHHLRKWLSHPPAPIPETVTEWRWVAKMARQDRTLNHYARVLVGGPIILTRIERGRITIDRIHEFDTTEKEFGELVAQTNHPVAQRQPCWCGSGKTYLACHLVPHLDEPCDCESGKPFRVCCMSQRP